jgi:hypothetical protein
VNLTLIAYRPDGVKYCGRGCCSPETTSSDFELTVDDEAKIVEAIARYKTINQTQGNEYSDWELTLLFDGREYHRYDEPDYEDLAHVHTQLFERADAQVAERVAAKRQAEEAARAQAAAEQARREAEAREKRERAEYERLQAKFGGGS